MGATVNRKHRSLACVVPPHMLEEMALRGDTQDREAAITTLALDASVRLERVVTAMTLAPVPATAGPTKQRRIYTANSGTGLPGTLVRSEGQGAGSDLPVNEAYDGFGATFDMMYDVYQRNSLDNAGMALIGTVHYGQKYNNAAWNGQQMFFGDGDGKYFNRFTAAIDVIGHELAHGITTHEANLVYQGQSGALNEHCSDVIGSLVKQYSKSPKEAAAQADWVIGAGLFTSLVNGVGIRSMKAPGTAYDDTVLGKDPQPDHMSKYVNTTADNGGVHINSGIPNRAFYLASIALGGYAWEKAGRIWYATMRDSRLSSTATFMDFAGLTVDNAGKLYGSSEQQAVIDAWRNVGIELADTGTTMTGVWTLHFSWGCTSSYAQSNLSFNSNGTFGGALAGKWRRQDGTLLLSFDTGPAKYAGTLAGQVGSGAMTTFAGLDGCWYLTKQGITGVTA
jgi:hypothetical protein